MKTHPLVVGSAVAAISLFTAACGLPLPEEEAAGQADTTQQSQALVGAVAGSIPAGMPARLIVGLTEANGLTWMKSSGVRWDARYRYFTKGWVNNYGWGNYDGSWGLAYLRECDAGGFMPAVAYYQMNEESGGGESSFLAKAQNATTMRGYFGDFKILMQRVKDFGKPALILLEADGYAELERQSNDNPNAYAAVAATGMPELAGLPNTVAGWGLAFLQIRKAVGANNAILGIHVSAWASGKDIAHSSVTDSLGPEVTKVANFLKPLGLAPNQTGATYDVLVGDPLDRDADYYRLTSGSNRWWDASDSASINSRSFNRYAEWMRLWNVAVNKRWVLWQIPLGNSNHLNVYNNGGSREGYKDNRPEYFFGGSAAHLEKFASSGAIALLFGRGTGGMSSYQNDTYTDGQLFMKSRAGAFLNAGGLAIPAGAGGGGGTDAGSGTGSGTDAGSGTAPPPTTTTPAFTSSAAAVPSTVVVGGTTRITATVSDTGAALSGAIVDLEIYGAAGRVAQTWFSNQSFSAGQTRTFTWDWTAPATAGSYTVKIGVFGAGWTPNYSWNGSAGTVTVTTSTTTPPPPPPPPSASDPAQYGFENGTQGWVSTGGMLSRLASSTTQAFAGSRSLAVSFTGKRADTRSVYVGSPATPAGATVTIQLWIPTGSKISSVRPYVLQGSAGGSLRTGTAVQASTLTPGAWNTLSVTVPAGAATPLSQLGVEFQTSGRWRGTAYLDSVRW